MTAAVMNDRPMAPVWLKVAAAIGVIWYAFGLLQFWLGFSMDRAAAVDAGLISGAHAAAIDATPLLIWLAFAIASGAGLLGAILLLIGSTKAKVVFGVSIVSALIYYAWVYAVSGTGADRPPEESAIAIMVVAVTAMFWFISRRYT